MTEPPNFNRLAKIYQWMEWMSFGPWLSRCRCAFLPELSTCRNAIILGDGDGRFTARLLATNSSVRIEAVDCSSSMLKVLVRRASSHSARLRTCLADAREWQPARPTEVRPDHNETHEPGRFQHGYTHLNLGAPGPSRLVTGDCTHNEFTNSENALKPYDLIVTHFFLDCLTTGELESLSAKLRRVASPSAVWLVSDFAVPSTWFGRVFARPLVAALYATFGFLTGLTVRKLPDHSAALVRSGFNLQERRTWLCGLLVSELWSATAPEMALNPAPKPAQSEPRQMLQSC